MADETSGTAAKVSKAEKTRQRILETALRLFRERGFDGTTMRGIAAEAGVSLGNAYYYFKSKEHLIHAYYGRSHVEHIEACAEILETERSLKERLRGVLRAKIDTSQPYHRFAGQLFKTAADPTSPLSPFGPESMPVRREATELMERVFRESEAKVSKELSEELPHLLWLYLMGIILYWIHDRSEGCRRTNLLIDRTVEIVARLIQISSLAPVRPLFRGALKLVQELRILPEVSAEEPSPDAPGAESRP